MQWNQSYKLPDDKEHSILTSCVTESGVDLQIRCMYYSDKGKNIQCSNFSLIISWDSPSHLKWNFSLDSHAMQHHHQTHSQCCLSVAGAWFEWLCSRYRFRLSRTPPVFGSFAMTGFVLAFMIFQRDFNCVHFLW